MILYGDNLVLIAEGEVEEESRFRRLKGGIESKDLITNVHKTKVTISCEGGVTIKTEGHVQFAERV